MNEFERACREWMRGCSCAPDGKPWECVECTEAFHSRLVQVSQEPQPAPHGLLRGVTDYIPGSLRIGNAPIPD